MTEEFDKFRVLGKGGFGMVYGCKSRTTGKMYAMKEICMKRIKKRRAFELCWNELQAIDATPARFGQPSSRKELPSPWASQPLRRGPQVRLPRCGIVERLVLVIDLMMGGDLNIGCRSTSVSASPHTNSTRFESVARPGLCLPRRQAREHVG